MKKQLLALMLLFYSAVNFAQQQNNHWYFGYHAHLNFNLGAQVQPTQPTNQYMPLNNNFTFGYLEGCATVSDYTTGALKFYSNGSTVYGANHLAITNGTGLLGDKSSAQNIVFVPQPKANNMYYAFTIDGYTSETNPSKGFFYSQISAVGTPFVVNGVKNIPLKDHSGINIDASYFNAANLSMANQSEAITTARHSNGVDYWVIAQVNNYIYTYLVDCNGVNPNPVASYSLNANYPNVIESVPGFKLKISQSNDVIVRAAKVSSDGIYADENLITGTFNRSNGQIAFNNMIALSGDGYALEFSNGNSEILYYSHDDYIMRYNFATGQSNILASGIYQGHPIFDIQMAPNGIIYVSADGKQDLGSITNSNDFVNAVYNPAAIRLAGFGGHTNPAKSSLGLPQLVQQHAPVLPVTLVANNDAFSANSCSTTTSTAVVQANDTSNGVLITSLTGLVITPLGLPNPTPTRGGITLNANGTVTVLVGTPVGTYTLPYQICTSGSCPTCSNTSIITVNVTGGGNVLVAVNDTFNYDECALMKMNVKYNNPSTSDSINGSPILTSTTGITVQQIPNSLSPVPTAGNVTINATGIVSVDPLTPPGTYTLRYKLLLNDSCGSQSNEATVTINVNTSAIAQNFTTSDDSICIFPGQTSTVSIFDNDTIGGLIPTASDTVIAYDDFGLAPGITVNADGTISVAAGTPNGTYLPGYYLSQKCLSSNISLQQKIFIVVGLAAFGDGVTTNTSGSVLNGNTNILTNDRFGCDPLDPTSVSISYAPNPYFSINTTQGNANFGQITLISTSYTLGYYNVECTVTQLANPDFTDTYNIFFSVLSSLKSPDSNPKEEVTVNTNLNIYPNPSSGIFNIQMNGQNAAETNFRLAVYNALGQVVVEKTINQNNPQIDLSGFDNGTYFLKLQMGEETINRIIVKK